MNGRLIVCVNLAGDTNRQMCTSAQAQALRDARPVTNVNRWPGGDDEETEELTAKKRRNRQPTIADSKNMMEQLQLEDEYCVAFCESHIPWVVTDRPAWRKFLTHACKSKTVFRIPNRNKLSCEVLKRQEKAWEEKVEVVKRGWDASGVTISCDGWTDAVGRSIVVIVALGGDAPVLIGVVDANQTWQRRMQHGWHPSSSKRLKM